MTKVMFKKHALQACKCRKGLTRPARQALGGFNVLRTSRRAPGGGTRSEARVTVDYRKSTKVEPKSIPKRVSDGPGTPRRSQMRPRSAQERPRSLPENPQPFRVSQEPPRASQESPRSLPESPRASPACPRRQEPPGVSQTRSGCQKPMIY